MKNKLKNKKQGDMRADSTPRMYLSIDHIDINSNGAAYAYYNVKQWKSGQQMTIGKATVNLSKDFRMVGLKGQFTLDLFSDKMTRYEQDR